MTHGPRWWNRLSRRPSRRPRQPLFSPRRRRKCRGRGGGGGRREGTGASSARLNGQVFTEGRPGRVLSYRHHLFSMPISVAHTPVGPTARNPQRRREGKKRRRKGEREREEKKIKVKGRGRQAGGRPFRERAATSALWNNPSLCSSAITTNYSCERWLRARIGAKPLVTGL